TDFGGKTSIFSHPVYLFLREFSLQDSRGGSVGTSAVSLGLTANYARTGGQVTAGNVQSIIGVTFVYQ
ncbi:TPA: hypothetical protein ACHURF_003721, partial [Shigella flexneri]